jgi:hypothetical protein
MIQIKSSIFLTLIVAFVSMLFIGCGGNAPYSPKSSRGLLKIAPFF